MTREKCSNKTIDPNKSVHLQYKLCIWLCLWVVFRQVDIQSVIRRRVYVLRCVYVCVCVHGPCVCARHTLKTQNNSLVGVWCMVFMCHYYHYSVPKYKKPCNKMHKSGNFTLKFIVHKMEMNFVVYKCEFYYSIYLHLRIWSDAARASFLPFTLAIIYLHLTASDLKHFLSFSLSFSFPL